MADNNSKRVTVPISVREKNMVQEAKKAMLAPTFPKNKASQWMAESNVKAFNKILLDKAFSKHIPLTEPEVLEEELYNYFKTCFDNEIIPTITSLCTWLGVHRDTIYGTIANKGINSDKLSQAVDFCHTLNENGAISGSINSVLYMFLSKNYYGMHDNSTINLTTGVQDTTIDNNNTMKVIQEQIALENTSKTNLNMSNSNETS